MDYMICAHRIAGFRKVRRVDWNENLPVSDSPGTVIFLRETDVPEMRAFTHFTIVTGTNRNDSLRLFDSCGISRLEGKPEERMLKCKARPTPISPGSCGLRFSRQTWLRRSSLELCAPGSAAGLLVHPVYIPRLGRTATQVPATNETGRYAATLSECRLNSRF